MDVVVTFLVMANFLSTYHVPGPMLRTLHVLSHLTVTKTPKTIRQHIITIIPILQVTKLSHREGKYICKVIQ